MVLQNIIYVKIIYTIILIYPDYGPGIIPLFIFFLKFIFTLYIEFEINCIGIFFFPTEVHRLDYNVTARNNSSQK